MPGAEHRLSGAHYGQFKGWTIPPKLRGAVAWKPHPLPEYCGRWKQFSFHAEGKESSTSLMVPPQHMASAATLLRCLCAGKLWWVALGQASSCSDGKLEESCWEGSSSSAAPQGWFVMQPRSKPCPLPVRKCFKAVFYIPTVLFSEDGSEMVESQSFGLEGSFLKSSFLKTLLFQALNRYTSH